MNITILKLFAIFFLALLLFSSEINKKSYKDIRTKIRMKYSNNSGVLNYLISKTYSDEIEQITTIFLKILLLFCFTIFLMLL